MSNDARTAVDKILRDAGAKYSVKYRGERDNPLGNNPPHLMDAWECAFDKESFKFFTGLGLRAEARCLGKRPKPGTQAWEKLERTRKPVPPHAADVLYCLLLDSDASTQSFESWCSELGYDSDSRKALVTYEACQRNADKLARVLSRATLDELQTALQDY